MSKLQAKKTGHSEKLHSRAVRLQTAMPKALKARVTILVAVLVAVPIAYVLAQATRPHIKFEAEQGSFAQQAIIGSDALASGGSFVGFSPPVAPPSGVQFQANFETAEDFNNRFYFHVGNYCYIARVGQNICWPENDPGNPEKEWSGDHNLACEGPTTSRTIHVEAHNEMFWWCAPRGPESGHVMTSLNTSGYTIIAFTPRQVMTNVRRVCWDVNSTHLGGGKWTNVIIVPEAEIQRHPNPSQMRIDQGEGPYRLDYTTPGFNNEGEVGDFNIQTHDMASGTVFFGLKNHLGTLTLFRNNDELWHNPQLVTTTDKAARYRHCMIENTDNSVTVTRVRPSGTTDTYTVPGLQFPDGQVRVIFQDDNYDPPKRDGYSPENLTWHWDGIVIE